jgi:hypothetical protein
VRHAFPPRSPSQTQKNPSQSSRSSQRRSDWVPYNSEETIASTNFNFNFNIFFNLLLPHIERRRHCTLSKRRKISVGLKVVDESFPICPGHLVEFIVVVHLIGRVCGQQLIPIEQGRTRCSLKFVAAVVVVVVVVVVQVQTVHPAGSAPFPTASCPHRTVESLARRRFGWEDLELFPQAGSLDLRQHLPDASF